MRAGHSPAFGGKRGNRGRDDLNLFAPELAAFAGMRVEPGHGEPRLGNPEMALKPAQCCAAARFDQALVSARATSCSGRCVVTGIVRKRRAGEHHHDIAGRHAAALGHEFGLAGVLEANRVELLLGQRAR